jgi:hypothetical protein
MFKGIVGLGAVVAMVAVVACGGGNSGGGGTGAGASGTTGTGGSSGSVHFDCCINDSHFVCPSQSALDQCSNFVNPDPSACAPSSSPCGGSTSSSSGSGTGTGTGTSSGSTGDLGNQCTQNSDCQYDSCLVASGADFGYCTKTCMDFTDCPTFWSCDTVGNATGKYCIQN